MEMPEFQRAATKSWIQQLLSCAGLVVVLLGIVPELGRHGLGPLAGVSSLDQTWLLISGLTVVYVVEKLWRGYGQLRSIRKLVAPPTAQEFRITGARERFHNAVSLAVFIVCLGVLSIWTTLGSAFSVNISCLMYGVAIWVVFRSWQELRELDHE